MEAPPRLVVEGDADRLHQAVLALATNAIRHTPPDAQITLRACTPSTDVAARIEVADTGPGIAAEHLPHLFDRFYRADPGRSGIRGSGLGLAIVAAIATAHGGSYAVRSTPGSGSTFTIDLPS